MQRKQLYLAIELQPEVICRLEKMNQEIHLDQFMPFIQRLTNPATAAEAYLALKELTEPDPANFLMLYCQMEAARHTADRYQEMGIDQHIFIDTMKCFPRFLNECKARTGQLYFDRGWWTYRQISMTLFRIGQLEYERSVLNGENVIKLHIPSDADLSPEKVSESLRQATAFFHMVYPDFVFSQFACNSWLLSPALKPFLSQDSHILNFQKRFTLLSQNSENREFIQWLFQVPEDTEPVNLPEKTSLQRGVKALLLSGGNVGNAYGVICI